MIKPRMMVGVAVFLLFYCLAYGELSCDLSQGALNGLRIGRATNPVSLKSILSEPSAIPESFVPQMEFYKFLGRRGVEIVTKEGGSICGQSGSILFDQKVS